jgi:hypothetical protein
VKKNGLFAVAMVALMVLAILSPLPLAQANSRDLQKIIENGFMAYLNSKDLDPNELSEEEATDLFLQFQVDKPQFNDFVKEYQMLTGQYDTTVEPLDVSFDELKEAQVVDTLKFWYETIDGIEYAVEETEIKVSDEISIYKVTYYSEDGEVKDPYIYCKKKYLYVRVLWWKVKTGELITTHYRFLKNANGINEASRFRNTIKTFLYIEGLGIGIVLASLAPFTYGLTAIVGVPVTAFCIQMIILNLDTAYDNSPTYLELVHRVNWNYAGVGSWFDIHTIWQDDGSWHMILLPYIDLYGINCRLIAQAYKVIGDTYGYDRWIWAGTYYG